MEVEDQRKINNAEVWEVLNKIREQIIHSSRQTIIYTIPFVKGDNSWKKEVEILKKLSSMGAIKVIMIPICPTTCSVKSKNKVKRKKQVLLIPITPIKPKFEEVYLYYQEKEILKEGVRDIKRKVPTKFIKSIYCVKPKSGNKFIMVINDDYQNTIKGDQAKLCWRLLFEVAEKVEKGKEGIWYSEENHKNLLDYFNSNKSNRIYTQTGYKITKILKVEGGYIVPTIKLKVISEKAFKTRLQKTEKRLKIA